MAVRQKVDYAALQVAGVGWGAYPELTSDIGRDVYRGNIQNLVAQVYKAAHSDKMYLLMQAGADKFTAAAEAVPFAENYLDAATKVFGDIYDTRTVVNDEIKMQCDLWLP